MMKKINEKEFMKFLKENDNQLVMFGKSGVPSFIRYEYTEDDFLKHIEDCLATKGYTLKDLETDELLEHVKKPSKVDESIKPMNRSIKHTTIEDLIDNITDCVEELRKDKAVVFKREVITDEEELLDKMIGNIVKIIRNEIYRKLD